MFDLSTSQYIQAIAAMAICLLIYIFSSGLMYRKMLMFVIIIFPFQFIDTKYGSINVYLILVIALAVFFNRRMSSNIGKYFSRIQFYVFMMMIMYFVSFFYHYGFMLVETVSYLVILLSSYALFFLVYTFINNEDDLFLVAKCLIVANVLVLLYCGVQLIAGFHRFVPFGIDEFAFQANRAGHEGADRRLMGPFNAAEIVAEYFVLMNVLLVFLIHYARIGKRNLILIFLNFCAIIGTASRGGIVLSAISVVVYVFMFRRSINTKVLIQLTALASVIVVLASFIMLRYTDFNIMYERLQGTEIHGVQLDTRGRWSNFADMIAEKPFMGYGIRLLAGGELEDKPGLRQKVVTGKILYGYPHNLYIYLLYTVGLFGFVFYLGFYGLFGLFFKRLSKQKYSSGWIQMFPRFGIVFLALFLIDQYRIEYLRHYFSDIQHFIAILFAMVLALEKPSFSRVAE